MQDHPEARIGLQYKTILKTGDWGGYCGSMIMRMEAERLGLAGMQAMVQAREEVRFAGKERKQVYQWPRGPFQFIFRGGLLGQPCALANRRAWFPARGGLSQPRASSWRRATWRTAGIRFSARRISGGSPLAGASSISRPQSAAEGAGRGVNRRRCITWSVQSGPS